MIEKEVFDFASSNNSRMLHKKDEGGFNSVGGLLNYDPLVVEYSADRWHWLMLIDDEEDEEEEETKPKEYINDESYNKHFKKSCNSNKKL